MKSYYFMKRYLSLFALLSLSLIGCHKNEEVLTQPIDSIRYTTTTNQYYTRYSYYYYNQDKRLIRIVHKNNGQEIGQTTFAYDKNGRLAEKIEDIGWRYDYIFKYDDEGRLIARYGDEEQFKIIYDSIGRVKKKQILVGDYNVTDEILYRYDSIDVRKVKEEMTTNAYSNEVYYHLVYYYNDEGQLYEKYLMDGVSWFAPGPWEEFEYNPNGQLSRKIKYERNVTDFVGVVEDTRYFYY